MPQRKRQPTKTNTPQWRRMDLHLHTPASADYRESNVSYLDILKKAEQKGLDIIAITDHNTAAGYRRYIEEIEDLELLERRNRLTDEERTQLQEFRRLREKILVLPGFELTATLGFHVLGLFPPELTVRELEHLLLNLHVPSDRLDVGSGEVGATTDVLTAYRLINEAGGLAIAAHANSSHGVAMPGFDFGGQTRIAYTQDENLHALEVTDLTSRSRRRTQLFFSGTKPEYPRKMHCVQGSDAHRLNGIQGNNQELGVGDRPTEVLLPETTFDALLEVFLGKDFSKTRPYIPAATHEFDPLYAAREEGDTLVQAFHESAGKHGIERRILQDVVALANTNGGTVYVGASANLRLPVQGVPKPVETANALRNDINKHIVPPLDVQIDTLKSAGKMILQMIVPRGSEVPYALDSTQIYVRSENETSLAVRDEIVNLVRDAVAVEFAGRVENAPLATVKAVEKAEALVEREAEEEHEPARAGEAARLASPPPHTGVEIVTAKARARGDMQYTMRDLRNNRIIHNVTRSSARKLWQYAISEHDRNVAHKTEIKWLGDVGILKASERAGKLRYDLVQRDSAGELHFYYGVTDDGIHGVWKDLVESTSGQAMVVEVEEENGSSAEPEAIEATSAETAEASEMLPTFMAEESETPPLSVYSGLEVETRPGPDLSRGEVGRTEPGSDYSRVLSAVEAEAIPQAPGLLTTPGRNLFPPVISDLASSTSETDQVSTTQGYGVLPAEPTQTEPSTSVLEVQGTAMHEATRTEHEAEQAPAAAEPSPLFAHEYGRESSQPSTIPSAETAPERRDTDRDIASERGTPAPPPSAIQVANAPTTFAKEAHTEIVSGETLAPIREYRRPGARVVRPDVAVNLDDQIVLPPSRGPHPDSGQSSRD